MMGMNLIIMIERQMMIIMSKTSELNALKSRRSIILSRGKTIDGEGVLRKINRKIRNLEKK